MLGAGDCLKDTLSQLRLGDLRLISVDEQLLHFQTETNGITVRNLAKGEHPAQLEPRENKIILSVEKDFDFDVVILGGHDDV